MSYVAAPPAEGRAREQLPINAAEIGIVVMLTLIGGALRFAGAHSAPGFWHDEALYSLDALRVLREPGWPLAFFAEGHDREPMFMYILAAAFKFFGPTVLVARSTAAMIGTLTIPALWLMGREFGGRRAGLLCAGIGTFLFWHLVFSSLCFRTILAPLFAALSATALHRFGRVPSMRAAVIAGSMLGLGAYTYLSWRLVPFILLACGFAAWRAARAGKLTLPMRTQIAAIPLVAMLVFAPLGMHFALHPKDFVGRATALSLPGRPVQKLLFGMRQTVDVALMYGLRGDPAGRHNLLGSADRLQIWWLGIPNAETHARWEQLRAEGAAPELHGSGLPVFDIVTGALFYLGLGCLIVRASSGAIAPTGILAWLAIGSLASILSYGAPNLLRLTFLIPAAVYVLAVGFEATSAWITRKRGARMAAIFLMIVLSTHALVQVLRFRIWVHHPETASAFNLEFAQLGEKLHKLPAMPVVLPLDARESPTTRFIGDGIPLFTPAEFSKLARPEAWIEVRVPPGSEPLVRGVQGLEEALGRVQVSDVPWGEFVIVTPSAEVPSQ